MTTLHAQTIAVSMTLATCAGSARRLAAQTASLEYDLTLTAAPIALDVQTECTELPSSPGELPGSWADALSSSPVPPSSTAAALAAKASAPAETSPAAEAPQNKEVPPAGPPPPHTGVKATLRAIPGDFAHLPSRDSAWILAAGSALTLLSHPYDDDVNNHLKGNRSLHNFFAPGKVIGYGPFQVGAALATYAFGRATDNRVVSHLGMDLLRSTIEVGAVTYAIKLSVRRDRPNNGACCSFPSGHAAVTFAMASTLWRHLGWKAAVPTYTVATYVALSRLHENRHFLSDVVMGSTLGIITGKTVTRHGRSNYVWEPVVLPGGGLGVRVSQTSR